MSHTCVCGEAFSSPVYFHAHRLDCGPYRASPGFKERICPTCKIRWRVRPTAPSAGYSALDIPIAAVHWLERAARVFDELSEESGPAVDFVDWCKLDITSTKEYRTSHEARREIAPVKRREVAA